VKARGKGRICGGAPGKWSARGPRWLSAGLPICSIGKTNPTCIRKNRRQTNEQTNRRTTPSRKATAFASGGGEVKLDS